VLCCWHFANVLSWSEAASNWQSPSQIGFIWTDKPQNVASSLCFPAHWRSIMKINTLDFVTVHGHLIVYPRLAPLFPSWDLQTDTNLANRRYFNSGTGITYLSKDSMDRWSLGVVCVYKTKNSDKRTPCKFTHPDSQHCPGFTWFRYTRTRLPIRFIYLFIYENSA
jgi:hypothetical protein